jgi:hypothetical protein
MRGDLLRPAAALIGLAVSSIVVGCTVPHAPAADAARPSAWRIGSLGTAADPTMRAVAAGLLAYLQDSADGNRIAASARAVCIGYGPASGGPFRMQQFADLDPALLDAIAARRPKAHPVSACETTLKGAPLSVAATGEAASLLACLTAGEAPGGTISLLCGFYDGPIASEFIGYDVTLGETEAVVRRNGRSLTI